jgi:tetratricopeptide (TPR) repeat protein
MYSISKILPFLLALPLAVTGCKKKEPTKSPEETQAEQEAKLAKARKQAKMQSLIELANQDLRNGRFVSASKRADEALAENPDNADAYAVLGAARWRSGDFVGSTEAFEKALELDPDNFGAGVGMGRNLQCLGRHEEAIEIQDRVLAKDKDQIDPMLTKLWSLYALTKADDATKVLDELFKFMPQDDPLLPLIQAYAAFVRPLEGKGPFMQVSGTSGKSDLQVDTTTWLKHSGALVGGEFGRAVLLEVREETYVDKALADKLGLKEIAKLTPPGQVDELPLVIVPEVKLGELTLKNVPALVQSLEMYAGEIGETPAIILGRQALLSFGGITFDFPGMALEVTADPPAAAPDGATEVPLLMISMRLLHAPAIPLSIDGSEHQFYAYLGGGYGAGVAATKKAYLKSGHLPREIDPPDDADQGLKMVYIDKVKVGDIETKGAGGLVMVNSPPDAVLGQILENTAFELGGYVNMAMITQWKVTYVLSQGRAYITA